MTGKGKMNNEWLDELSAASDGELIEKLRYFSCDPYFYDLFDPLVEEIQKRLNKAEPVRRGRWTYKGDDAFAGEYACSNCNGRAEVDLYGQWILSKFCPHCGALMEEEEL